MKLLVVEDDPNLGFILQDHLEDNGFEVDRCQDGESAFTTFSENSYDLCIVDVMLPKLDGFNLVKRIRQSDLETPMIFVTAKQMKEDKIHGFKLGADDYLTKPFSMDELLCRIEAILRRTKKTNALQKSIFEIGQFRFDYDHRVLKSEGSVKLTSRESELLKLLSESINQTVTRETILLKIWGDDTYHNGRSLDVFITKLRKHLSADESIEISSIHGTGYKLVAGN